ncbi:hypothetical protein ALC56_07408 [Trachymyrmex septentrionalis]|uniref:Uncharacterized protein n=1 Tax=Trachymyrmex septentrionalis TaxID=34720 RepID=A0A195FD89_9HYME|nr:hypothetical protein ALC56_07408 [Trachymyrmex septentrionalis]
MYFNIDRHSQGVLTTARERSADYIQQTAHTTHTNMYTPTSKPYLSQNLNVYVTTSDTCHQSSTSLTYKSGSEKYKLTLQKNKVRTLYVHFFVKGEDNATATFLKRSSGNDGVGEKARDQTKEGGTSNTERLSRQGHDMSSHGTAY